MPIDMVEGNKLIDSHTISIRLNTETKEEADRWYNEFYQAVTNSFYPQWILGLLVNLQRQIRNPLDV